MNKNDYDQVINRAIEIQKEWRTVPAPKRGELIRVFGNHLRQDIEVIGKTIMQDAKNTCRSNW